MCLPLLNNKLHKHKSKSTTVQNVHHTHSHTYFNPYLICYVNQQKKNTQRSTKTSLLYFAFNSNYMKSGKLLFPFNLFILEVLTFWSFDKIIVCGAIIQTINATKSKCFQTSISPFPILIHWNRQWMCYLCVYYELQLES